MVVFCDVICSFCEVSSFSPPSLLRYNSMYLKPDYCLFMFISPMNTQRDQMKVKLVPGPPISATFKIAFYKMQHNFLQIFSSNLKIPLQLCA